MNAIIFGELAVLIAMLLSRGSDYQNAIDTANIAMTNIKLQRNIQQQVREYFSTVQTSMNQQDELAEFIEQISPSLNLKVTKQIFTKMLKENNIVIHAAMAKMQAQNVSLSKTLDQNNLAMVPALTNKTDGTKSQKFLISLVEKLGTQLSAPEYVIIQQYDELNEETTEMYFVSKGECFVNVIDETGAE
jgi:hypothetical protein